MDFTPTGASSTNTTDYLKVGFDGNAKINSYGSGQLFINDDSHQNISLSANGGVVTIGQITPNGNYKLFVRDGIRTEAIKVDLANANSWSNYVFDKNYDLKNLHELEKLILKNKHLPDFLSASELVKTRVDMLEMDSKLLAKIEELTLYIIEQNKRIENLEKPIKK